MKELYSTVRQGELPPDIPDARAERSVKKMGDPGKLKAGERPALPMSIRAYLKLNVACASVNHELPV